MLLHFYLFIKFYLFVSVCQFMIIMCLFVVILVHIVVDLSLWGYFVFIYVSLGLFCMSL